MTTRKLGDDDILAALQELPGWERQGEALVKEFALPTFRDAISFMNRIADKADAADHHPTLENTYTRVKVVWSTHSAGGITEKDVTMARVVEGLA